MRYIDLKLLELISQEADLNELQQLTEDIAKLSTEAERKKFIKKHSPAWSKLRFNLWMLGHFKCWYSEVRLESHSGEVEHFRPKGKVAASKPKHTGYWWRAFDWKNYRLAHAIANKRKTDINTGKLAGKGTYFPLRLEAQRANRAEEEKQEEPSLLDPTVRRDCGLIRFNLSSGKVEPSYQAAEDSWKHKRAIETIGHYHLNEARWNITRKELVVEVQRLCDKLISTDASADPDSYEETIDLLVAKTSYFAEFTSIVKQAIIEKLPDNELIASLF